MPKVRLTRRYRFSAAHRLHTPALSAAENLAVYGKCNNPYGHGHDYLLEVTLAGSVDPSRGRLVPLMDLDGFVQRVILDAFDRRNLNVEIPELATLVPTTENLALVIANRLREAWVTEFPGQPAALEKIRIHETRNNIFETTCSTAPRAAAAADSPRVLAHS
jgi:6-pyruvoyltetrahydropterin/6-carboxytetrahydropterin synthase